MVKFILNDKELEVEAGTTILNAARSIAIEIPTFCYQDRLSILASCRMCLVEVEGMGKLVPACSTPVTENMVVLSHSQKVVTTREDMLEILLANHPLDCPICDKGGECELQDTVFEYGKGDSRLNDKKRVFRTKDIELNNVIIFNADRCIQCQRCVRVCEEVVGEVALGTAERGLDSEITGVGNSLKDCSHCGNCIEVCPVGALMSTPYRYKARPWDMVQTDTICNMCGTGCSLTIETREGELSRVKSKYETGINGELLCAKGRFGFDAIDGGIRIKTPMIRKAGKLTPVSLDEAIEFITNMARSINHSGGHIEGHISARQTNETAYMFQKLMRSAFNSDLISASNRFSGLRSCADEIAQVMRSAYSRAPLSTVLKADLILLVGSNITEENPVTGYLIRERMRDHKNQLFVATSKPCGLDDIASSSLRLLPGNEGHLMAELMSDNLQTETDEIADFVHSARSAMEQAKSITLFIGTEFLRTTQAAKCLAWINMLAGQLKRENKQVYLQFLLDRPNQLGVWDMGCHPQMEPGWQHSDQNNNVAGGAPDMLYVLGADCNPHQGSEHACLVVQDSHMSAIAEKATVLLPAPSYGEETGTFTNNEGRVQHVRKVRSPAKGTPQIVDILKHISTAMEIDLGPTRHDQIFAEIKLNVPQYADLNDWSDKDDLGMTRTTAVVVKPVSIAKPDFLRRSGASLITGDSLYQSGQRSARSKILSNVQNGNFIEMNPSDISDSDSQDYTVTVKYNGTRITAPLKVNKAFPKDLVFVPENLLYSQKSDFLLNTEYPCDIEVSVTPSG